MLSFEAVEAIEIARSMSAPTEVASEVLADTGHALMCGEDQTGWLGHNSGWGSISCLSCTRV